MAHTPGPWKLEPRHQTGVYVTGSDEFHSVICQIREYQEENCAESFANARLIAAAPDLLASLRLLVGMVRASASSYTSHPDFKRAEAAIAKAEGQ